MSYCLSIKNRLFLFVLLLLFLSCESDPVTIDSSFSENNSFFTESFSVNTQNSYTYQDSSETIGSSFRLYAGNIEEINSKIFMDIDMDPISGSKFCSINSNSYSDSTIHSIDSLQLVLRTYTEVMDEDSTILLDIQSLQILAGFSDSEIWDEDSTLIFEDLEVNQSFENINLSSIQFEANKLKFKLPFDDSWCDTEQKYSIVISYTPDSSQDIQCLELTSSEYYYPSGIGINTSSRPSLNFSYNQFNEIIEFVDRFQISSSELQGSSDNIYHVNNDTLSTNSKVFIAKSLDDNFNNMINSDEIYLTDIAFDDSFFSASENENDFYQVKLILDIHEEGIIPDSLNTVIDFILDSIVVIPSFEDPAEDNAPLGTENNGQFDSDDTNQELFLDLGFDWCPDLYEAGNDSCLCDFINDYDSCILIEDFVYNQDGTEGNGLYDEGEQFSSSQDIGVDGCPDNQEGGLNEVGNPTCLEDENPDYQEGSDPNEDNYLYDPSDDNWKDCGADGLCNEDEDGYDSEMNPDPTGDDWGYGNIYGSEGNGIWEEGEGLEGNGQYDVGEPFMDIGVDGIPEEEEWNCVDCIDDSDTEGNEVYDYGEPYQDTGLDEKYNFDEPGYNPSGTEGNNSFDYGEIMLESDDCGEDGNCDDNDISDDYNIDPNNDNWRDCGTDGICIGDIGYDVEDEDGTQDNEVWDEGELYQGNNQYDSLDTNHEFYYDWGIDQMPDSLEVLQIDNILTYSAPSTISYTIDEQLDITNNLDESKDILFDVIQIKPHTDPSKIEVVINITANTSFRAIQFRLNHSPYIHQTEELSNYSDLINQIDQNDLFEDISVYNNMFDTYDFSSDSNLILDYLNGIKFAVKFDGLAEFISNNPDININNNYTTLGFYPNYEDSNYNFFDGLMNIYVKVGDEVKAITAISAASHNEVLIPFGAVIENFVLGDMDPTEEIIFFLDGVYDNRSRMVFHKNHQTLSPRLEIFYSK